MLIGFYPIACKSLCDATLAGCELYGSRRLLFTWVASERQQYVALDEESPEGQIELALLYWTHMTRTLCYQ